MVPHAARTRTIRAACRTTPAKVSQVAPPCPAVPCVSVCAAMYGRTGPCRGPDGQHIEHLKRQASSGEEPLEEPLGNPLGSLGLGLEKIVDDGVEERACMVQMGHRVIGRDAPPEAPDFLSGLSLRGPYPALWGEVADEMRPGPLRKPQPIKTLLSSTANANVNRLRRLRWQLNSRSS